MTDRQKLGELIERPCEYCGKVMHRADSVWPYRWRQRRFCSQGCGGAAANQKRIGTLTDRLKANTKRNPANGCLEWTGQLNQSGYGTMTFAGKTLMAHRAAYTAFVGPIPDAKQVLHRCDNRRCTELTHLFLGNPTVNNADRDAKQRQARGERCGRAILSEDDVRAIRQSSAPHTALAKRYGVGPTAISSIRNNKSWKHVRALSAKGEARCTSS